MVIKLFHFDKPRRVPYQLPSASKKRLHDVRHHYKRRSYPAYLAPEEALFYQMIKFEKLMLKGIKHIVNNLLHRH